MKKFLSVMLCMLMLSAMAIPAMAEGEVTILDLKSKTNIVHYEASGEDGYALSGSTRFENDAVSGDAISDRVFETGLKVKTTGGSNSGHYFYLQVANKTSFPIINAKFMYGSNGMNSLKVSGSDAVDYEFEDGEWYHNEWNEIKFVVKITDYKTVESTSYSIEAPFVAELYLNGTLINTFNCTYKPETKSGNEDYIHPFRTRVYKTATDTLSVNVDDIYLAKYNTVTSFVQETVTATANVGETVTLPETVNVAVDGVTEAVSVDWADVDTTTAGTKTVTGIVKGYTNSDASDVTVTAIVTVEAPQEPKYPYELAIADNTLTITKAGTLTPEAKVYGAVYENGLLTDVQILGTVSDNTEWADGKTTLPLDEGKTYRAFVVNSELVPYAVSTELN